VQTLVAVPSGRTMIMGGLITSSKGNTTNGLPLLDRIPILGGLFGKQTVNDNRTELVLFITPRVIDNELDYDAIMNDIRRRMENLDRVFPGTPTWPAAPPSAIDRMNQFFTPRSGPTPPPPTELKVAPPPGQPTQAPPPAIQVVPPAVQPTQAPQPPNQITPVPVETKN
jgi:Flp pilus assembly secretin CpaC